MFLYRLSSWSLVSKIIIVDAEARKQKLRFESGLDPYENPKKPRIDSGFFSPRWKCPLVYPGRALGVMGEVRVDHAASLNESSIAGVYVLFQSAMGTLL